MVVRRDGYQNRVYYHCSRHYRPWDKDACTYHRFVPGSWDETVWDCVFALLIDNSWIEEQMAVEQHKSTATNKLLDTERRKITQIQAKIAKTQEGFEAGIYATDEAKKRIVSYQNAMTRAEQEIERLRRPAGKALNTADIDTLRQELRAIAERNLDGATFEERRDVISKLDVRVYPSEDLKTMRIKCGLNFTCDDKANDGSGVQCGKIIFGGAGGTIGRTFSTTFILVY